MTTESDNCQVIFGNLFEDKEKAASIHRRESFGAVAQLGEHLHGMQEVVGSNPTSSTRLYAEVAQR